MFNINSLHYNLKEHSLEFYISGCRGGEHGHCKGCHNPDLWDETNGIPFTRFYPQVEDLLRDTGELIKSFRVYGGEPLEKDEKDLIAFISWLKLKQLPVWLFTRFSLKDVPDSIKELVDYLKCGPYIEEERSFHEEHGVMLATLNQHIYKKGEDY